MIRRDFLIHCATAGASAALALCLPAAARATASASSKGTSHAHDWDWLLGNWDVRHSRLKERLAGNDEWQEFGGKSAFWTVMGGLGNLDDNLVELPGDSYRGLSIRAFDPVSNTWAIWWLDARNPTHIDPPVRGGFEGETGTFIGRDTLRGKPILMRFRWRDLHSARPWWEQAFSPDDGASWEINWRNWFTRTAPVATPLPLLADAPRDWDFLVGDWRVRHRRLRQRLTGSDSWDEFDGTLRNWPVLGGHGNVGDNLMRFPGGDVRGLGIRAYDPAARQWSSWWLDGRDAGRIAAPLRGGFADGVGTFTGQDVVDGKPVLTRVLWSRITPRSARWEQSASADGGASWETNWVSEFERA